ncbi:MAG TPA: iron dicitrate transport regulator FecR [Prolixibacteraceae bacterium]|nr:iron dicitrate transport regulator FecR [Prolixibacteraceae bacterium]
MKQEKEHIDLTAVDRQSKAFFKGGKFHWQRSEAEVWANLQARMDAQPKGRSLFIDFSPFQWVVAASIVVLFALGSFLRFYSITVETSAGQHFMTELPDHSKVNLNAQSTLTYHPYWWKINRLVQLQGEAYFEVEKGRRFTVVSTKGITQVMGTSFNIYARDEIYKVTCITGSVKVKSPLGIETILQPNSKAEIQPDGKINVQTNIETFPEISWKKNIFLFTASPVLHVFSEIERQYGVKIETRISNSALYSGNFTKDQNVDEILGYICPALGLKYSRISGGKYLITKQDE